MNERFYGADSRQSGYDDMKDSPRQYRSEASKLNRLSRIFGGDEPPRAESQMTRQTSGGAGGVVIYSPKTYEDVQLLIDHLKMREQIIVDFTDIAQATVYRILDFMSGAIYALGGSIKQIKGNIFLFAPSGVTITVPPNLR